ncbi:hypothetical protein ACFSMW_19195 [Virgibacillus halophilus]|uniref:hypothetical protein n=1 Tax=Tigheibacillus halophilus TaxID=361280 RepID=UPI0036292720
MYSLFPLLAIFYLHNPNKKRCVSYIGTALTILGTLPFVFSQADTSTLFISLALILRGAGLGAVLLPVMATAYTGLSREEVPHVSSMTRILQQIGGAFGASVLAIILQSQFGSLHAADIAARNTAFNHTFMWTTVFTAISLIFVVILPNQAGENHSLSE